MFPQFDADAPRDLLTRGMAASPGAAAGKIVFDSATAVQWAARGEDVLLVRRETTPDDLSGMIAATGVLTSRGGKTSHAAVVVRGMGRTCVCGAESLDVDAENRVLRVDGRELAEGAVVSIDGTTGEVFAGAMPVVDSLVVTYLEQGLDAALATADPEAAELVRAVDRLLRHADRTRRLRVRANADTAQDATRARRMGAEGIGLCRTEHMFLGERRVLIERLILADDDAARAAAARCPTTPPGSAPASTRSSRPPRSGRATTAPPPRSGLSPPRTIARSPGRTCIARPPIRCSASTPRVCWATTATSTATG
jgi:pyruvate,orthophosphate dikinase